MSKKYSGLKNYIDDYLENREDYEGALDRESYKETSFPSHAEQYKDALKAIFTDTKRQKAEYGTVASTLNKSGLTGSGYAARINELAAQRKSEGLAEALKAYDSAEDNLTRGYLKYLQDYKEKQGSLQRTITSRLISEGFLNTDDAYSYAKNAGLNEKGARAASKNATDAVRKKLIDRLIKEITQYSLDDFTAVMYATELGLSKEDVEKVALYAKTVREHDVNASKEFLEYLESIGNKGSIAEEPHKKGYN